VAVSIQGVASFGRVGDAWTVHLANGTVVAADDRPRLEAPRQRLPLSPRLAAYGGEGLEAAVGVAEGLAWLVSPTWWGSDGTP